MNQLEIKAKALSDDFLRMKSSTGSASWKRSSPIRKRKISERPLCAIPEMGSKC